VKNGTSMQEKGRDEAKENHWMRKRNPKRTTHLPIALITNDLALLLAPS